MPRTSERALLIPFCIATACGGHRVAHVAPDESRPHISWEIRTGGAIGDNDVVCGSSQPSRECVLAASAAERRSLVTEHLYLHAAKEPTSYLGVMQVPFMEGSTRAPTSATCGAISPGGSRSRTMWVAHLRRIGSARRRRRPNQFRVTKAIADCQSRLAEDLAEACRCGAS